MKQIKVLLAAVIITAFSASCSSDDNGDSTSGNIMAKWTPTKTVTSLNGNNQDPANYSGNEAGCDKDYTEFLTGGVVKDVVFYHNAAEACTEDADASSTWSKNGNTLVIDGDSYEITKLTGSELRYKSTVQTGGATLTVTEYFTKVN